MKKNKWVFMVFAIEAVTATLSTVLVISAMPYATITVLAIGAVAKKAIEFFELNKEDGARTK